MVEDNLLISTTGLGLTAKAFRERVAALSVRGLSVAIDHVSAVVEAGRVNDWVEHYRTIQRHTDQGRATARFSAIPC